VLSRSPADTLVNPLVVVVSHVLNPIRLDLYNFIGKIII
jgi:hypothetical protein